MGQFGAEVVLNAAQGEVHDGEAALAGASVIKCSTTDRRNAANGRLTCVVSGSPFCFWAERDAARRQKHPIPSNDCPSLASL